jgi:hypothetical protein
LIHHNWKTTWSVASADALQFLDLRDFSNVATPPHETAECRWPLSSRVPYCSGGHVVLFFSSSQRNLAGYETVVYVASQRCVCVCVCVCVRETRPRCNRLFVLGRTYLVASLSTRSPGDIYFGERHPVSLLFIPLRSLLPWQQQPGSVQYWHRMAQGPPPFIPEVTFREQGPEDLKRDAIVTEGTAELQCAV